MFIYDEKYKSKKEGYYYSCSWLERGLVFFPHKLSFCCHCGHTGGGHTLIRNNFDGQNINWDRFLKIKTMFKNFHKEGKINSACIGCPFLKYKKWEEGDYIENLYISHWTYCNAKCIYCYERQNPDEFLINKNYKVLPFIKELHETGTLRAGGKIYFGGGEPAILDEFEDIITYLLDNFYWGIRVHSSGIKYSPAMARAIEEVRGYMIVSVDAGSKEIYKKIKQVDCYDIVRENIRKYALKTNFKGRYLVCGKYIIIPGINDNKEELEKWLMANKEAGLWTTSLDIEEDWYLKNRNNIPEYIYDLIKYVKKRSKQLNTNFEVYERMENMLQDEYKKTHRHIVKLDYIPD